MQQLLRRQPPVPTGGASTSGRPAESRVRCPLQRLPPSNPGPSHRHLLPPCRITSTAKELFMSEEAKKMGIDDNGEEAYVDLPDVQLFDPDKGPFEKRIQRTYQEAMHDDKIDLRETEYWFSTPEGNWNMKPKRLYFMEEEEPMFPQPWHPPGEEDVGGDERIALTELEEGRVYLGMVTDVWLYHGVQIDIGAEFDGLVPCNEVLWETAVDHVDVGDVVMVEIHQLRTPGLYRWPVQLKFTDVEVQQYMMPPDMYDCPVDHAWAEANGWSIEDVAEATGRSLDSPSYFLPHNEQRMAETIIDGYGTGEMPWRRRNSPPVPDYIDDPLEEPADVAMRERRPEVDAAAASAAALAMRGLGY